MPNSKRMIPPEQSTDGLSNLRRQLAASRGRSQGATLTEQEILDAEHLSERVAIGVVQGMELLMTDERIIDSFWQRGYQSFARHGSDNAARWIGSRLWVAVVMAVSIGWFVWTSKGATK